MATQEIEAGQQSTKRARDRFSGRAAFIIACVGSAVGMGNIWLFPYRVAEFGGAAFLIPYFIFVALLGFSGVVGEMAFGRAMETGPIGAFAKAMKLRGTRYGERIGRAIGFIPTIGSLAIAIGYSVVVGWFIKYLVSALTGELSTVADTGAYFSEFAVDFGSIGWHFIGLALTFAVMIFGISRGIERLNKIMMPLFFVLFVVLLIRVATLPGAGVGYEYLFVPNWESLADPKTWVYALGQAFFSLSLAGSGTLVYGSYLKKDVDVVSSARSVAVFDTLAALLAAMVVIPAVFAFGFSPTAGPPLMFITLPAVFQEMPAGGFFAVVFFAAVLCAAITSLVNLFETPIEAIQNQCKLSRK
ncbi:MAG: sodium-dependent transporter, partial [Raoultibacter sp.]